ncbi:MAG: DNA polymerase III subunit gamma/tau [Elusimicrobia bacterium]|nr:DNA polymerase III subunit gamma/tau [Elusimicrobiota bacterium]
MAYENLAAKYRPATLGEVMGQETIKQTLQNAVKLDRVAHSYVFYGPRGCGKTTIARILAKTLNCHHPKDGAPCGKCASCTEIAESKSIDVIEIDAASNTGVDKVRSVIIEQVGFAPSRDKYKVYILDEVHMLSTGAFNALLKTVEEPPAHVVFVMATTEQNKVPATILSRSQCFRFRPISEADIAARLKEVTTAEKIKTEPEALRLIARSAGGAMRDAITMLDRAASFGRGEVKAEVVNELLGHPDFEVINSMALALVNRDGAALHAAFDKLTGEGYDALATVRELRNNLAAAFLAAQGFGGGEPVRGLPKDIPPGTLARLSRKLNVIIEEVKFSDSQALAAEVALFTLIETPQDLDALVRRLEGMESRLASGAAPELPPASGQKKNEALAPAEVQPPRQPAVPAARPAAASSPAPSPAAVPAGAPADAWKKLLGQVAAKRPSLYNVLLSVKIVFSEPASWRLISGTKFETGMVEKACPELEEMLERFAGMKIKLTAEQAAAPVAGAQTMPDPGEADAAQEETIIEDSMEAEAAREAPAPHRAASAPRQVSGDEEPELKHLNKVFHGRITKINKVK